MILYAFIRTLLYSVSFKKGIVQGMRVVFNMVRKYFVPAHTYTYFIYIYVYAVYNRCIHICDCPSIYIYVNHKGIV